MRRTLVPIVLFVIVGSVLVGCGDDDDSTSAGESTTSSTTATTAASQSSTTAASGGDAATVATADVSLGTILVDDRGQTLYLFTSETGTDSACNDACAQTWPPLTIVGESPVAGDGVDASLLGTARRDSGVMQVTYNGHRLYHYAGDKRAGDTEGQGIGSSWYVVSPAGEPVK